MTNIKCSHCGLVSARTNGVCKGCGASLTPRTAHKPTRALPKGIPILVVGCVAVIVAVIVTVRFASSKGAAATPSPNEVKQLLSANEAVNLPITATLLTELTQEWMNGDLTEDSLLQDHPETLALKRLGLANVEFRAVPMAPECYRYDSGWVSDPKAMKGERWVHIKNPNGALEQCDDIWEYHTTITLRDPETVDQETIGAKISSLSDVGLTKSGNTRQASGSSTTIPIGSVEILEVSDVVVTQEGSYTVGFKCRFNPNSLGTVFDVSNPIFKSMPLVVRDLFVDSVNVTFDKRLSYINASQLIPNQNTGAISKDGIAVGHAELMKPDSIVAQWKIKNVFFDQKDQTKYTYHPVD